MTDVFQIELPASSRLHELRGSDDFLDCYAVASDRSPRAAAEVLLDYPRWTRMLLALRNAAVAPLGLTTQVPDDADKIGLFPVDSECAREIVAGFDDKHLNFRISVLSDDGHVYLSTWVHPHNLGGRLYLAAVMPFHVVIVRDALRRLGRA